MTRPRWSVRIVWIACLSLTFVLLLRSGTVEAAWAQVERIVGLKGRPVPASRAVLSEHEIAEISALAPQQQAERLLERAVNHYDGAAGLIEERVDGWRGSITFSSGLGAILQTAFNSNDLRVRAAAVEVSLVAYNLPKTDRTVDSVTMLVKLDEGNRGFHLWTLGLLGNRGAGVERARQCLIDYLRDPSEQVRQWAVNGLALLGTDEVIPTLLHVLRNDVSLAVRERAACSLAESGMLTREQRKQALPELLRLSDDSSLPSGVRKWVFQALRDITGQQLGEDPAAWRNWHAQQ